MDSGSQGINKRTIPDTIEFLRRKDYKFVRELGRGACGHTILLNDETIDEKFVCKKYVPFSEDHREDLFKNFIKEIKLLHQMNHINIVRVFNYYIYDELQTGYILMELVDGNELHTFLHKKPEMANEIFLQAIDGFAYLEKAKILHRDIRPQNIMIGEDEVLKIIDFGFGKNITSKADFDKSLSLNWWCETPDEFSDGIYDYKSEIYFVGKLFEEVIRNEEIDHFKYKTELQKMCRMDPSVRVASFADVKKSILEEQFLAIDFSTEEKDAYRAFSSSLYKAVSKVTAGSVYYDEVQKVQKSLESLYKRVMLEEALPDNSALVRCFVSGAYYFSKRVWIEVDILKDFISLLRSCSVEKKNIILSNIHSKLDSVQRYSDDDLDDEIPF